ncbi:Putative AC9 transposase [Rhizoctonia solani AG-1 IB]|uniref:Putative AC9 transposase n=1 Tax=Thanatephorus cucumeris (strain AG1-IB / isolate 7/3/14) TaxID=1108050 RepID=M5C848_THACB|nr:Putative AC9 transposase [Rhizoctonia solani AG-1 IB]
MNLGLTFQAILASLRLQKKSGRGEQKDMFLRTYAALTTSSPGYSACTACSNRVNGASAEGADNPHDVICEDVTPEGLARYIAELVADQDLAFNIVQAKTFRRLLCYVGQGNIQALDIPERRTVAKVSSDLSQKEKDRLKEDMKNSQGRISFTSDLWTDSMERPFMAVTGHYINAAHETRNALMAFRVVEGAHAGAILAQHLFGVLKEYDVVHKIGSVTLDNATNNNTMMEELAKLIRAEGYNFDKEGNRIRCFPHVINLAVTAFLDALDFTGNKYLADRIKSGRPPTKRTENYVLALRQRPDKKCRATVVALRKGQRRVALRQTIIEGNERGHFKRQEPTEDPGPDGTTVKGWVEAIIKLRVIELLLDVPTRWSSTRLMLDRFVEQYPAIWEYLSKNKEIFSDLIMSDLEYQILQDILACLDVPHRAQELLSAEQTPTLSLAFPVYDQLIYSWRQVGRRLGPYAYAIECGIAKIEDYVARSRSSPIHIVAMVLNPCLKYTWIDARWTPNEKNFARETVKRFMLQHLEARERRTAVVTAPENLSTKASKAQGRGVMNLFLDSESYLYHDELSVTPPQSPETPVRMLPTPQRPALNMFASSSYASSPSKSASESLHREAIVNAEHERYISDKVLPLSELGRTDLVKHWKSVESTFSLMHALAMDVLPAQASSVSSERVFSSSKLTCTRARNKMKANTVESLQILKYALRNRYQAAKSTDCDINALELHKSERDDAEEVNGLPASDLMACLGDADWSHDAILDVDLD